MFPFIAPVNSLSSHGSTAGVSSYFCLPLIKQSIICQVLFFLRFYFFLIKHVLCEYFPKILLRYKYLFYSGEMLKYFFLRKWKDCHRKLWICLDIVVLDSDRYCVLLQAEISQHNTVIGNYCLHSCNVSVNQNLLWWQRLLLIYRERHIAIKKANQCSIFCELSEIYFINVWKI